MSYDLYLRDPITGAVLELDSPHHMRGGTYCVGGTTSLTLNVTYNYGAVLRRCLDPERGIRVLYGMTGAESLPLLERAAASLGDEVSPDYWEPVEGNVKRALLQLRAMAVMRPEGVWDGD